MRLGAAIDSLVRGLGRLNAAFGKAGLAAAAVFLAAMTLLVLIQVVFRYGFNSSLGWSEELGKTMMVWLTFLVTPAAYRRGLNVSIDIFAEAFPDRARNLLDLFLNVIVAWILGVFLFESLGFVQRGSTASAATLPIAMAWFYTIVPVSLAAMLLVAIEFILLDLRRLTIGPLPGSGT